MLTTLNCDEGPPKNFAFSSLTVCASFGSLCHSDNRTDYFSVEGIQSIFYYYFFCIEMKLDIKFLNIFREWGKKKEILQKLGDLCLISDPSFSTLVQSRF